MRTFRFRDAVDAATLLALLAPAWCLPQRAWPAFARRLGQAHVALRGGRLAFDDALLARLGVDARELDIRVRQHNAWELLELLREHAPWGWRVPIVVTGREHLDAALAAGRGAVLWYCPFAHADVVFKRGLHEAGYRVAHLSAWTHGFSDTRFGLAVLNPVKTRVEQRYLAARCAFGPGSAAPALRELAERLRANGVVSITALHTGRDVAVRPLFGGTVRLAKGAPRLALATGAALLPLFVVPAARGYEVRIESPLRAPATALDPAEEALVTAFVAVLERYVAAWPALWRGWLASPGYWAPTPPHAAA